MSHSVTPLDIAVVIPVPIGQDSDNMPVGSYFSLPGELKSTGHKVTLLSLLRSGEHSSGIGDWRAHCERQGMQLEQLSEPDGTVINAPWYPRQSYLVYLHFKQKRFDVICFPESTGPGFYCLLAKQQGLAFQETTIIVGICGPTVWNALNKGELVDDLSMLECDYMERMCVKLADSVVCPSKSILNWMTGNGWVLPEDVRISLDMNSAEMQMLQKRQVKSLPRRSEQTSKPLVSVCLVHFNRPGLLSRAVDSLLQQDYPNYEVILVDDGSTLPEASVYLESLEEEFKEYNWRIIRQDNRYLGAARNTAAGHAQGKYLLFMDDDNIAMPHEISTFVRVADHTGADILTCVLDVSIETNVMNKQKSGDRMLSVPLGDDAATGLYRNCFGDANALVKSDTFRSLGGFTEDYGIGNEDWEFFASAVLKGYNLQVVPEPLVKYRMCRTGMLLSGGMQSSRSRNLRPYLDNIPVEYRNIILLAYGIYDRNSKNLPALVDLWSSGVGGLRSFLASPSKIKLIRRFIISVRTRGFVATVNSVFRYGGPGSRS